MKTINNSHFVTIPEGVKVNIKSRIVTVTGPRGTLIKNFKHVDIEILSVSTTQLKLQIWFGVRKHNACIQTVATLIENMITGVTKGYEYKMKSAYAHFPININISDDKANMEIRNFLGEKVVRTIKMPKGIAVRHTNMKDEISITGNSLEDVSQSAAVIQQSTSVKNKDIRKFLDGVYVSSRGVIEVKTK